MFCFSRYSPTVLRSGYIKGVSTSLRKTGNGMMKFTFHPGSHCGKDTEGGEILDKETSKEPGLGVSDQVREEEALSSGGLLAWRKRMVLRGGKKVELTCCLDVMGRERRKSRMPARSLSWYWQNERKSIEKEQV